MNIPIVSSEQMAKIDELAIKYFGIEAIQLMENAGRCVAELARLQLKGVEHKNIVVLAGKGNNGGDGLIAARHLHNWGANVDVIIIEHPDNLKQLTKESSGVLRSMHVQLLYPTDAMKFDLLLKKADLVIDGLLGYSAKGDPRGFYADIINMANQSGKKILAIDIPSGLNPDTGVPENPCIKAKYTLALALPKKGLAEKSAKDIVGELYIADIGIPNEVYEIVGLNISKLYNKQSVMRA